ncbi:hypothetical protein ACJMK2_020863 [Sinanodonta woodiana]|uniref:Uncharacterized protein n=1 Tax=Sinanodonta woodiana TaxID=1069815 RepID=A0ABD3U2Q1_SINWO
MHTKKRKGEQYKDFCNKRQFKNNGHNNIGKLKRDSTKCMCKFLHENSNTTNHLIKPKHDSEIIRITSCPYQMPVAAFRCKPTYADQMKDLFKEFLNKYALFM